MFMCCYGNKEAWKSRVGERQDKFLDIDKKGQHTKWAREGKSEWERKWELRILKCRFFHPIVFHWENTQIYLFFPLPIVWARSPMISDFFVRIRIQIIDFFSFRMLQGGECMLEVEKVKKCDDDSWPIYHRVWGKKRLGEKLLSHSIV